MITLILGPETYVARTTLQRLKTELAEVAGVFDTIELASKASLGELQSATNMMPLLGGYKMVIARDWLAVGAKDVEAEVFEAYLKTVPAETRLIFVELALDKRLKLSKLVTQFADVVAAPLLDPAAARSFVVEFAKAEGINLPSAIAAALVERIGTSQWQLHQEILKLGAFAAGNSITREMVESLTPKNYEDAIFDLIDSVVSGQSGRALFLLQQNVASGMHGLQIFRSLGNHYRRLLYMRLRMDEGAASPAPLVKDFKTHPYAAEKIFAQARRQKSPALLAWYQQIGRFDQAIKKGQIDVDLALTYLVTGTHFA